MKNRIELEFHRADTRLAGNPYGKEVFIAQVREKIDYTMLNTIVFPENIEKVASSFVQGFFEEIIKNVGYEKFDNVIQIEARNEVLVENIRKDLIF